MTDNPRLRMQAYGAGEYFGTDASTSLGYTHGGRQMLIFAVLTDSSGLTHSAATPASECETIVRAQFVGSRGDPATL